jgi:hypothetical protein
MMRFFFLFCFLFCFALSFVKKREEGNEGYIRVQQKVKGDKVKGDNTSNKNALNEYK